MTKTNAQLIAETRNNISQVSYNGMVLRLEGGTSELCLQLCDRLERADALSLMLLDEHCRDGYNAMLKATAVSEAEKDKQIVELKKQLDHERGIKIKLQDDLMFNKANPDYYLTENNELKHLLDEAYCAIPVEFCECAKIGCKKCFRNSVVTSIEEKLK